MTVVVVDGWMGGWLIFVKFEDRSEPINYIISKTRAMMAPLPVCNRVKLKKNYGKSLDPTPYGKFHDFLFNPSLKVY